MWGGGEDGARRYGSGTMARHYGSTLWLTLGMRRHFDEKNKGTRSDPTRGLGAAFPLSAAVEPIAHGGEPRGICVEQGGEGE